MKGLSVAEINSFSGGMNSVTAPYLISKDEATLLVNSDVRRGAMWSMPRPVHYDTVGDEFFFQFKFEVYTYSSWRSNVEWDNTWYWSDGLTTGKVLADGTAMSLGIPTPTVAPTVALSGAVGGGSISGSIKYCYTFYNHETGVESAPSKLASYIKPDEQSVSLSGFQALPSSANRYRIYRIGGYLPYFMLVATVSINSYLDKLDDTEIDGRQLQTIRNGPPPQGIKFFTELNGRMYGAVGNTVYFSALGNPDSWYVYDVIPCKDTITGIAKSPGGLIICGHSWSNLLKGNDPSNFNLRTISDSIGMVSIKSLGYINKQAIWLTRHGLVTSDGYNIKQLTIDKIDNMSAMDPVGAVVLNNTYFMVFKPSLYPADDLYPSEILYPASTRGTGGLGQGAIMVDFKRGSGYSYQLMDFPRMMYVGILNSELGMISGNSESNALDCQVITFPSCAYTLRCGGYELSYIAKYDAAQLVDRDKWSELSYISPLYVEGSTATLKEYDKVRIVFMGDFTIKILFDNDRVLMTKEISTPRGQFGFEEALIGIPNRDNKSYSIRYSIVGTGVIEGIQHSYKNRELP